MARTNVIEQAVRDMTPAQREKLRQEYTSINDPVLKRQFAVNLNNRIAQNNFQSRVGQNIDAGSPKISMQWDPGIVNTPTINQQQQPSQQSRVSPTVIQRPETNITQQNNQNTRSNTSNVNSQQNNGTKTTTVYPDGRKITEFQPSTEQRAQPNNQTADSLNPINIWPWIWQTVLNSSSVIPTVRSNLFRRSINLGQPIVDWPTTIGNPWITQLQNYNRNQAQVRQQPRNNIINRISQIDSALNSNQTPLARERLLNEKVQLQQRLSWL